MTTKHNRIIPLAAILLASVLSACNSGSDVAGYWDGLDVMVTESNYPEAEERFAVFAELSVACPKEESLAALDKLLDKLMTDEVSYIIYSEWLVSTYHSLLSPCRNTELYAKCAERFRADGILSVDEYAPLLELAEKNKLNQAGQKCSLPPLKDADGNPATLAPGQEAVIAVINLDCASCVSALNALSDKPGRHLALCFGHTSPPRADGWDILYSESLGKYFDLESAPFWFSVGADGIVITSYSIPPEQNSFAKPQI